MIFFTQSCRLSTLIKDKSGKQRYNKVGDVPCLVKSAKVEGVIYAGKMPAKDYVIILEGIQKIVSSDIITCEGKKYTVRAVETYSFSSIEYTKIFATV
jgi:hypothetical protein